MSKGEFNLINRLFKGKGGTSKPFTQLGIGDDASIHQLGTGMELLVSTDTSVQNVHWPDDFPLDKAADRAVCSALSDLAAMGAEPVSVWLNVMAVDSAAVEMIGQGATGVLKRYDIELAGGDTCRSATNALSVTVAGSAPLGSAMRRDRARSDDAIWLAGSLGFHSLGLKQWMNGQKDGAFVSCFETIMPLLEAGVALRQAGVACCIDVSDGLLQDANHICSASGIGMDLELAELPGWSELCAEVGQSLALQAVAKGGEDYALLFTAPAEMNFSADLAIRIGQCNQGQGARLLLNSEKIDIGGNGFDHFN